MKKERIRELKNKGWNIGEIEDFLGLSEEEMAYIELKIKLSDMVRELREKKGLTQVEVSQKLNSSQSRISKMESGDPSVSIDLQIKSLLALGATQEEIGKWIGC
ncbi:MAG: helix-turn-helix transcriptional regulator [Anaerolineales bacterium]